MRPPDRNTLTARGKSLNYAPGLHPVPASYKNSWQIFTMDSPWEGDEFMEKSLYMSTSVCMQRLEELEASGELYCLYGFKRPRRFVGMSIDPKAERWRAVDWASPLEVDPDPEWRGHR